MKAISSTGTTHGRSIPFEPKYVSTVDSGNLIASLWVLGSRPEEIGTQPQLEERAFEAWPTIWPSIIERFPPDHTTAVPFETLRGLFQEESSGIEIVDESGWRPNLRGN